MKNLFLILFFITFSLSLSAQRFYEKGYFLKNDGERIECFVKNEQWILNPISFSYQLKKDGEVKKLGLNDVQEISINAKYKFVKATLNIGQSSDNVNLLNKNPKPDFKKETVFLNHLIEGAANLYSYSTKDFTRYFYQVDNGKIEQLTWSLSWF